VIGSFLLGATSLQDFGLALVIGLTSGAYSSIFIASPLLAWMKEREPRYVTIRQRLETRGDRAGLLTPAAAAAMAGAGGGSGRPSGRSRPATTGVIRPGAATASRRSSTSTSRASATSGNGAGPTTPSGSGGSSGGTARASSGSTRPGGNRPPPRPRKGKGSKGGKKKRR
jgi:preprotein translocase subunit SecF